MIGSWRRKRTRYDPGPRWRRKSEAARRRRVLIAALAAAGLLVLIVVVVVTSRAGGGSPATTGSQAAAGNSPAAGAPTVTATPAVRRIERDQTGKCIPPNPRVERQCDSQYQDLWENKGDALKNLLAQQNHGKPPTYDQALAAYLAIHLRAGDLRVLSQITQKLKWPAVRITAVGLSDDPRQEYVEVGNLGGAATSIDGLYVQTPTGSNSFALRGSLGAGQSCRIYTAPDGQPDACSGSWDSPNTAGVWPRSGGVATLAFRYFNFEPDRWYYWP